MPMFEYSGARMFFRYPGLFISISCAFGMDTWSAMFSGYCPPTMAAAAAVEIIN